MSASGLFQRLVPLDGLKETVHRFPLSVICSTTFFILALLAAHDVIDDNEENWIRIMALCGCGFFWFGITKIIAESSSWSLKKEMALALPVIVGLASLIFASSLWGIHLAFVTPALLLILMVAPYVRRGDDLSFWFFNRVLWFGVLVSFIALFLFTGGVSAALGAIHILFEVDIDEKVYIDIWLFSTLVLGPVYALHWVPKTFHSREEDCNDPPALKFIVNWISVPMVFVYLLILYAYFIKIMLQGELPNGQLAYLITGFAGAGILTYLVSWPLRNNGSVQLKLFHRIFFPALLVPTAFHFYAVWERVNAYGITEQRYGLILSVLWFAMLALGFTFKKIPIKTISATLAILLVFASFGPWGAVSVSSHSQISRLETLLTQNEILIENKIVKTTKEIPFESRQGISSILDYLCNSGRGAEIKPWFDMTKDDTGKYFVEKGRCYGSGLTEAMGFQYVSYYEARQNDGSFSLNENETRILPIAKYDYVLKNQNVYANQKTDDISPTMGYELPDKTRIFVLMDAASNIIVMHDKKILLTQSLIDFIAQNKDAQNRNLFFEIENDKIALALNFTYIYGVMKENKPDINNLSFDLFFRLKE